MPNCDSEIVRYYTRIQEERLREEDRRSDYTVVTSTLIPFAARSRIDDYGMVAAISAGRTSFPMYRPGTANPEDDGHAAAALAISAARNSEFWRQVNAEQAHALFLESMLVRLDGLISTYRDVLTREFLGNTP
jgi:hypothetical protein